MKDVSQIFYDIVQSTKIHLFVVVVAVAVS